MLEQFDRIICGRVAVLAYDILNIIAFTDVAHNVIDRILSQRFCELVCCRLSVPCVDAVIPLVDGFVWREVIMTLCVFRR